MKAAPVLSCSVVLAALLQSPFATAGPVRSVFASVLEGNRGNALQEISLWPNHGLNLSFLKSGEVIRQAWLDNRDAVGLSFDCPPNSADCSPQVLHLWAKKPSAPPTLLSLIAEGSSSGRRLYMLRINIARGLPQYLALNIVPDSPQPPTVELDTYRRAPLESVERGMARAAAARTLKRDDQLWNRLSTYVALVARGESADAAAVRAGVSLGLVRRLAEMGIEPSAPPVASGPSNVPTRRTNSPTAAPGSIFDDQPLGKETPPPVAGPAASPTQVPTPTPAPPSPAPAAAPAPSTQQQPGPSAAAPVSTPPAVVAASTVASPPGKRALVPDELPSSQLSLAPAVAPVSFSKQPEQVMQAAVPSAIVATTAVSPPLLPASPRSASVADKLAAIQLPVADGRTAPANLLLRVWLPKPADRARLANYINALCKTRDASEAAAASGMPAGLIAKLLAEIEGDVR